jgi:hypothetical protein
MRVSLPFGCRPPFTNDCGVRPHSGRWMYMELSLPVVLCAVFAIVVGYFAGRIISVMGRDDRGAD